MSVRTKAASTAPKARRRRSRRAPLQLELPLRSWGGRRPNAGRKPNPPHLRRTPHRARPAHARGNPVHVTLRSLVRSLRSQFMFPTVRNAIVRASRKNFRVVHFSVQYNHLHLIVEAESRSELIAGVRGLAMRLARSVNKLLFRRGRFW